MGPQVERQRRDNRAAEGCEEGRVGVPSPLRVRSGDGCAHSPEFFLNFYIKIVSFRAFSVAISYGLADCFTRIGNTHGIEIYWRSLQATALRELGLSLRKIARQKNDKNAPKITKGNCAKITLFFFSYISVFILLKFLRVVDWGHGPNSPLTTPLCRPHAPSVPGSY